jgi:hypothetical protein
VVRVPDEPILLPLQLEDSPNHEIVQMGSLSVPPNREKSSNFSTFQHARMMMRMGVLLGHVPTYLDDPGRFYGHGKSGPLGFSQNQPEKQLV